LILEFHPAALVAVESIMFPVLHQWIMYCPKFDKFENNSIHLFDIFIAFSLIAHEKSLSIPNDLENDFEDNLNFYVLCLLLGRNTIFRTLNIRSRERRRIINNVFQNQSREFSIIFIFIPFYFILLYIL